MAVHQCGRKSSGCQSAWLHRSLRFFQRHEKPTDPLAQDVLKWASKPGITSVAWNFTIFPSQTYKDNVGAALLSYRRAR
jgi:hypothetical protein